MSWDEDDLLKTDARSVVIGMALHPPLPSGPHVEAMIRDALSILQRAKRPTPPLPTDPVILTMSAELAAMVDWRSDPSVIPWPPEAEDDLPF